MSKLSQLSMLAVLDVQNNAIASVPPELGEDTQITPRMKTSQSFHFRQSDPDPVCAAGGKHVPGAETRHPGPGHPDCHELPQRQDTSLRVLGIILYLSTSLLSLYAALLYTHPSSHFTLRRIKL